MRCRKLIQIISKNQILIDESLSNSIYEHICNVKIKKNSIDDQIFVKLMI
jgi:hypothetical protein